jgi:hypothetical protein
VGWEGGRGGGLVGWEAGREGGLGGKETRVSTRLTTNARGGTEVRFRFRV